MKVEKTMNIGLNPTEILEYIPQQPPFRFIDQITYVNEEEICGYYKFKKDEFFYAGHFPNKPVTPGVILLESMSQIGVVAFGIYLLSRSMPTIEIKNWLTMFTDAKVEFFQTIYPEEQIKVLAKKIFWRKMKLRTQIEMFDQKQNIVATAVASGMGVHI